MKAAEAKAAERVRYEARLADETEKYNKMNQERAREKKERENEEDRRLNRSARYEEIQGDVGRYREI